MRDEETGKSKGFAFIKYEDQRSTVLAVDNLCGIEVCGVALSLCRNLMPWRSFCSATWEKNLR